MLKYLVRPHFLQLVDYSGAALHCPEVRRPLKRFPVGETTVAYELFNLTLLADDANAARQVAWLAIKGAWRRLLLPKGK